MANLDNLSTESLHYSEFHMSKPQMLCRALGNAKPLRNGVANATENGCKWILTVFQEGKMKMSK
jgi:hypothetical protein